MAVIDYERAIWLCQRPAMIEAKSRLYVPSARSDFTSKSSDTVGSPASILATRDWLDLSDSASAVWLRPRRFRRTSSPSANFNRSSM